MRITFIAVTLTMAFGVACGPPPPTGTGGAAGTGGAGGANPFCDVKRVLTTKCTSCHADIPNSGAPMPLTSYAATQQTDPETGQKYYSLLGTRAGNGSMPPYPNLPLSTTDKQVLVNWANSGGKGAECPTPSAGTCETDPNYCVGEQHLPCKPDMYFKAHARGDVNRKFPIPAGARDDYHCYRFKNPFYGANPPRYEIAEAPVIDNTAVIHHWLLFGSHFGADGDVDDSGNCVAPEFTDTLLAGWAPGGTNSVYPSDVGLALNEWPILNLQVHYNNPGSTAHEDASGIGICSTTRTPQNIAGTVTLGQDVGVSAPAGAVNHPGGNGTCDNMFKVGTGTATILNSWGHMHQLGSGFTTELLRGGQRMRYVTNIPLGDWSFDQQKHYMHTELGDGRVQVLPGDRLKTTCYYTNPTTRNVGFGTSTSAEMCYDFIVAYPISQLKRGCGALSITFRQ
ncbi:MAG TPA: hypothetical protein VK524_15855 [Polyangiaceae bacterium]|nr:hypothetical protein [Polyangiaceae bacterium]